MLLRIPRVPAWSWLPVVIGCGSSAEPQPPPAMMRICIPGTVYSCVRGACTGTETCADDGASYSPCTCSPQTAEGGGRATAADDAGPVVRDAGSSMDAAAPADAGV